MSGAISSIITLAVVGVGAYFLWTNKDQILAGLKSGGGAPAPAAAAAAPAAAASSGEYDTSAPGYKAPKGGYKAPKGGYNGTPGWYTIAGHHHCNKGESGCVCTDPKKCLGKTGTGHELCTGGKCAPGPGECRPDLGRYGATPCGDCPPGTGGGKCAGGTYKAGNYARSFYAIPGSGRYARESHAQRIKIGDYYSGLLYPDGNIEYIDNDAFALSNERISFK